jgi:acyl carrier protein
MKTSKILLSIALLVLMTTLSFAQDRNRPTEEQQRVAKRFVHLLHEQWGIDTEKISWQSYFLRDFGADSVDISELVMALEEDFDIEIYDAEWEEITTVKSAVDLIIDKSD